VRERLRADVERHGVGSFGRLPSWSAVRLAASPRLPELAGLTLDEIARRRGVDPFDALCDLLVADHGATRVVFTSMAESDVRRISGAPWTLVGSDGNSLATSGVTGQGMPHPRYYGTFARVVGPFVRELGLLSLPQAVHKMTGGSARALGLADRGLLREGYRADVTVFDPSTIADRATYEAPHQYATGVSTVIVNGEVVIDDGDHTGALPGQVLRRPAAA
jgi:N-acyl-D-aspartate/D-glutamate deacylase